MEIKTEDISKVQSMLERYEHERGSVGLNDGNVMNRSCTARCAGTCSGDCRATCANSCYERCKGSHNS